MEWRDTGIVLGHSPLGEGGHIVEIFTQEYGRSNGFFRKKPPLVGSKVYAHWRGRCEDHLGNWTLEDSFAMTSDLFLIYESPFSLRCLDMMCSLILSLVPAREKTPLLYGAFHATFPYLYGPKALEYYDRFEACLLSQLGYGDASSYFKEKNEGDKGKETKHALQERLNLRHSLFMRHWPMLKHLHKHHAEFLSYIRR